MGWLEGKVAVVTGGGSGIGRAVAARFVQEGARVCVVGRSADRLTEVAAEHGDQVLACPGDVSSFDDNQRAVDLALERFGRLDVFVANAGVFDCFARLLDMHPSTLDRASDEVFAVNVKGALFGARAALPSLLETGGNLIFTLSNAAFYPDGGGVLYTASKHALVGLIRQLALELAPRVRVNGVAPGGTSSEVGGPPSLAEICARRRVGAERDELIRGRTPLRFVQQPEDHVGAYVLLASEQGRAMTGTIIESDGGIGIRGMS
jgi:NAD(P)-dependent dehydrogenase (short-subunit alcohol dehydrogenase family)